MRRFLSFGSANPREGICGYPNSTPIFSRPSGRTRASSPPFSRRNRARPAGIRTTSEFPDLAIDTILARPQSPIAFARASIFFIASESTKDSPHESQISAGYSPRSTPNISCRTFPRRNLPLPQTGHVAIISPSELHRDYEGVPSPHNGTDLEVGVRSDDLVILSPLCSLAKRVTYLTSRDAAENHPLPRVAAVQDSSRHPSPQYVYCLNLRVGLAQSDRIANET